ncbi:hypothetical protein RND81_13G041800 [Saponaria officinalis]|uniref:Uncharacterized protein n=1 Tax=Saponaria officinalis TaxID=3572 RepID=A0AAW1GZE9_SAPOF
MTPEGKGVPDWVDLFVSGCESQQKPGGGKIGGGGLVTLIMQHLKIEVLASDRPLKENFLMDIPCLMGVDLLRSRKEADIYDWCLGTDHVRYLCLPRPKVKALTYGKTAVDYFLPPDAGVANTIANEVSKEESEADGETNATEESDGDSKKGGGESGANAESASDNEVSGDVGEEKRARSRNPTFLLFQALSDRLHTWMEDADNWREKVDAKLEAITDVLLETRELVKSLSPAAGASSGP